MNAVVQQQAERPPQTQGPTWVRALGKAESKFRELAEIHGDTVNWAAEANYARQLISASPELQACTPESIRDAVINIGASGLSLSPVDKLAHLVARNRKVANDKWVKDAHLHVSYFGSMRVVLDAGAADLIRADVVHAGDQFVYRGPSAKAEFATASPFDTAARGEIIGSFAEARLPDGTWLTEILHMDDIKAIREASKAKSGPWVNFFGEMAKKAAIRRLIKTIPRKGEAARRINQAVAVIDKYEGIVTDELDDSPSGRLLAAMPSPRPRNIDPEAPEVARFVTAIEAKDGHELAKIMAEVDEHVWLALPGFAPSGSPKAIELIEQAKGETAAAATEVIARHAAEDGPGALEVLSEFDPESIRSAVPAEVRAWIDTLMTGDAA